MKTENHSLTICFLFVLLCLFASPLLAQIDVAAATNIQTGYQKYITISVFALLGVGLVIFFVKLKDGWTTGLGFLLGSMILIGIAFTVYTFYADKVGTLIK